VSSRYNDYQFDSSKVEAAYGLRTTPYRQGIAACLHMAGETR